jgi:hypothetical protein
VTHTRVFLPTPGPAYIEFLEAIPQFVPNRPTASDPVWARLTDDDFPSDEVE